MKGVNFTPEAADRIETVVHDVERSTRPEGILQRRRAGGLGRAGIWRVTAVQTGPKTVTIKRIQNSVGSLNELSERTDVLYDIYSPPEIGDAGILTRLGDGTMFFFSKPGLARVYVTESCYIDSDNPDSTYGYRDLPVSYEAVTGGGTTQYYAIFKFASQLPPVTEIGDPPGARIALRFPRVDPGGDGVKIYNPISGDLIEVWFRITGITDDFDPSTFTWNDYASIGKASLTTLPMCEIYNYGSGYINYLLWSTRAWGPRTGFSVTDGESPTSNTMRNFFINEVYGFAVRVYISTGRLNQYIRTKFQLRDWSGGSWTKTNCFIEWFR